CRMLTLRVGGTGVVIDLICLALLGAVAARAQSATATLSGTVTDDTGAAVRDVRVTIVNTATAFHRDVTTGPQGTFVAPLLPPGRYELRAARDGFSPLEMPNVVLNVGDELALTLKLKLASLEQTVDVVAEPPRISTSSAVGTVVDRRFVENIPLNG